MRYAELLESIEMHPARLEIVNGETHINFPEEGLRKEEVKCYCCDGSGRDIQWDVHPRREREPDYVDPCECCHGKGTTFDTIYDFPSIRMTGPNSTLGLRILGLSDDSHGWIEPKDIPALRRKIVQIMNNPDLIDSWTQDPTDHGGQTIVDRSTDIPRITKAPRFIGGGVYHQDVLAFLKRVDGIAEWAQKHDCGVSWA